MRRVTLALTVLALSIGVAACGGGGGGGSSSSSGGSGSSGKTATFDPNKPVTLTVYSGFTERELGIWNSVLKGFSAQHPNVKIKSVGSVDNNKIVASIRAGNPPDVALSFETDKTGAFCSSGGWIDLTPYIQRDKLDIGQFPKAVQNYTQFQGKRCALPDLADVYGLYYNKQMLQKAGITSPPKTFSELAADAKKLTVKGSNGSIKVAGYIPNEGFYENAAAHYAPLWDAQWTTDGDKSALATSPGWTKFLNWHKALVDWYGIDNIKRFEAGAGQEFSAQNAFETGKVAMIMDGEYRTAFIKAEHPQPGLRHRADAGRRHPGRALRRRLHHRQHDRHPEGRQERRRGLGAAQVPVDRHAGGDEAGRGPRQRADHGAGLAGHDPEQRPALPAVPEDLHQPAHRHQPAGRLRRRRPAALPHLHREVGVWWREGPPVRPPGRGQGDRRAAGERHGRHRSVRPGWPAVALNPARERAKRKAAWRRRRLVLLLMSPWLLGFAVFFAYPLIANVYFSFTHYDLISSPRWIGLKNYEFLFNGDRQIGPAVKNTLWMLAIAVPLQVLFAFGVAVMATRARRGLGFFRTVFYLPALAPPVAATLGFVYILNPASGPVNTVLASSASRGRCGSSRRPGRSPRSCCSASGASAT